MIAVNRFLIIDDSSAFRASMRAFIKKFYPDCTFDEHDIKANGDIPPDFDWSDYDVLFLDYDLGDYGNGLDWYKQHKKNSNFPATIMLTGAGNERVAVKAIKIGIHEYLSKEALSRKRLSESINNAVNAQAEEIEKEMSMTRYGTTFNKSLFFNRLDSIANNPAEMKHAVLILILLDAHEVIGKTWGLLTRDNIIRHITKKTYQHLSKASSDLNITRYGDQYVAALLGKPLVSNNVENTLKGLCELLQTASYQEDKTEIKFTVSIAAIPLDGIGLKTGDLITLALDICRKEQETDSTNSFHIHTTETSAEVSPDTPDKPGEKFDIVAAVKQGRIVPRFQQIITLADETEQTENEIYDVRVRFLQTDGNSLSKDDFKRVMHDATALQLVDKWVVREVIGKLLQVEKSPSPTAKYAIKLTEHSLANPKFMYWVMELLKKTEFRKTSLLIEINAEDFLKHTKSISGLMSYLRNIYNFSFILSSLTDPQVFNLAFNQEKFEYIKLDKSLTPALAKTGEETDKAMNIIKLAHEAGAKVIAGWIEESSILYAAHDKKIDLIQGNFISQPREDIENMDQ